MHKKISATTEKIYNAFASVLLEKEYSDVRIQDVLDASGVARSTFYAHYKTKEDSVESSNVTLKGVFMPLTSNNKVYIKADSDAEQPSQLISTWFTKVPVVGAGYSSAKSSK